MNCAILVILVTETQPISAKPFHLPCKFQWGDWDICIVIFTNILRVESKLSIQTTVCFSSKGGSRLSVLWWTMSQVSTRPLSLILTGELFLMIKLSDNAYIVKSHCLPGCRRVCITILILCLSFFSPWQGGRECVWLITMSRILTKCQVQNTGFISMLK